MLEIIFIFAVLIFSIVIHEYAHGYAAYLLGDPTAKYQGRLTLNPLAHVDIFGTIILPIIMYLTAGFAIGWAKPVPYNPLNLRDQKWGPLKVALAGPGANLSIALFFGGLTRLVPLSSSHKFNLISNLLSQNGNLSQTHLEVLFISLFTIVLINTLLAVFNLIPVPPLDGSKIIYSFVPQRYKLTIMRLEAFGFIILIALLFLGLFNVIWTIVLWIVQVLVL